MSNENLKTVLQEKRTFQPQDHFQKNAKIQSMEAYKEKYRESIENPEEFWANAASELHFFKKWDRVLNAENPPFYRWFEGGKTNICYNCIDRHLDSATRNKAAIIWEGEPGDEVVLTYADLARKVNQLANGLKKLGVQKGDRIAIYLPMIPELAISVLACARIGAVHSVIFAGFSADSISDRINDCQAKITITSDGVWRKGKKLLLKNIVDEAVKKCPSIEKNIVVKRSHKDHFECAMDENKDIWYHDLIENCSLSCPAEEMDSEDMLFLLYTSGTTGKPKGIIHTTAGYMLYSYYTSKYVFDLQPEDVYWCTADIGWITGHSYIVYGPLANGATCLMYEGAPNAPHKGRFWEIVEKYRVNIFYTAPTAIRTFMKWGEDWVNKYDISSLRLLGTVGEPINPEAWMWYHKVIGKERCPIVDTWWQTETGGMMITPIPGCTTTKPGSATFPFFGIDATILDKDGNEQDTGFLAVRKPWPGMLRGVYGDEERFKNTYWSQWENIYFPGDGARRDEDGYFWILGRVDDVVNVSGHRIGTAELESIFVSHASVAESAVIGIDHEIKGQAMVAFVSLREGNEGSDSLIEELTQLVIEKIGKFAIPERIIFTADLPKTRSGKIMRRLLRDIAEGRAVGNVTTLADAGVIDALKEKYQED
ncbi:acetate--CoA ligase [Candidatus Uabimicrobium amorphum]|uniref:Acetyl-coenzyme A synthetase n=1 Tax=Uabimicrobium amorphum TaxID=2596890 RepID=A0A5S9F6V5_UABAM|nr:acetate--CoA ligase [Candidatus Uabimicrobium amorphum]BBM87034.1 acetyl-coenzyme A synthetase [Candidatus Uabimicrobium amorphum]